MSLEELIANISSFEEWTHSEKIKLFGWYLHTYCAESRFGTAAVRRCYADTRLTEPSSLSPFFKSLEERTPPALIRDGQGYYLERRVMNEFNARFKSSAPEAPISALLAALPARLKDSAERGYIEEALICVRAGASRAAIVLGWCAIVDRMRRKIEAVGFDKFNAASLRLKNETTGKFKAWNKGVQALSQADLLPVFDTDLMIVLEGMGLLDDNQAQRLKVLFQYRCHSAHPSDAPINMAHVVSFFTDAVDIVLAGKNFDL